jgi:hypothetical protein
MLELQSHDVEVSLVSAYNEELNQYAADILNPANMPDCASLYSVYVGRYRYKWITLKRSDLRSIRNS